MKWTLIAGGIALSLGAAWVAYERLAPPSESEENAADAGSSAELDSPRRTQTRTLRPVARAVNSLDASPVADEAFADDADDAESARPKDEAMDNPEVAHEKPALPASTEELEFEFNSESGNELFEVAGAIERTVATVNAPGARLDHVECRTTMCRVSFSFDDPEAEHDFMQKFLFPEERSADTLKYRSMSGVIPERQENEDGSQRVVMYLSQG